MGDSREPGEGGSLYNQTQEVNIILANGISLLMHRLFNDLKFCHMAHIASTERNVSLVLKC